MSFVGYKSALATLCISCFLSLSLLSAAHSQIPEDLERLLAKHGHALLIGVSQYKDTRWISLPNAADQIHELEVGLSPHFETIDTLIDPTVSRLRSALEEFFREFGDDEHGRLFVFYFGHGFTDQNLGNDIGFITGSDTPWYSRNDAKWTAIFKSISMRDYDTMTRISHARQILTVFDSCFSGTVFSSMAGPFDTPSKMDIARARQALNGPVRYYITAGRANEKVPADFEFATLLLRGIAGDAAYDKNSGFVTAEELGFFLQRKVPDMIGRLITPQFGAVNDVRLSAGQFLFRVTNQTDQLPGLYTRMNISRGVLLNADMFDIVEREDQQNSISDDAPLSFAEDVRGACLGQPLSRGQRLTWKDLRADCQ